MEGRTKPEKTGGPGENLTDRQARAIVALLSCRTREEAARQAEVSTSTLYAWLADPSFAARYDEARTRAFEDGIRDLRGLVGKATATLERNLDCGQPGAEIRAAVALLDLSIRAHEQIELTDRVEGLGRLVEELSPRVPQA